jgi:ABC-2 type transport system ATP-binding protein
MSKSDAKDRLKYWFDKLEIGAWWNKKIQELSKGQAQKIQFVVTVLHRPKLLIFDEPFSGFDPINANVIKDEILQLRDEGATVIFSTHRMESVEELCDHIALIHKSNKILDGRLNDIKRDYKTNTFEVGLQTKNLKELTKAINEKYEVLPATFKSLNDDLKLNIKLNGNGTSNDLLSFLTSRAEVHHFVEVIPSANDIFIQTVKNHY